MRLIDADALASALNNGRLEEQTGRAVPFNAGVAFALTMVEYAPTIEPKRGEWIDAVPVVMCKDCKWWTKQEKSIQGRCALTGTYPTGGWYCGNGERRDDEIDRR